MHACLLIPEILEYIFNFLDEGYQSGKIPISLVAAAMVCRTWSQPALNGVWRTQFSLVPLLKLLPQDNWEIKSTGDHGISKKLHIRRPIVLNDVTGHRFQFYASCIRNLILKNFSRNSTRNVSIDSNVFEALLRFSENPEATPLLPRLRHLAIQFEDEQAASMIGLFMQPSVQTLDLSFAYPRRHQYILSQLLFDAKNGINGDWKMLTHLDLWSPPWQGSDPDTVGRTVVLIGLLPILRSLKIQISSKDLACIQRNPSDRHLFQSLKSLNLYTWDSLDVATNFLDAFRPALSSLRVNFFLDASPSSFMSFATQLTHSSICHQLMLLKVYSGDSEHTANVSTFPNEVLLALAALPRLRTINLNLFMRIALTDDVMSSLAAPWPNLTEFVIDGRRPNALVDEDEALPQSMVTRPTFRGLAHFSSHHPKLVEFRVVTEPLFHLPPVFPVSLSPSCQYLEANAITAQTTVRADGIYAYPIGNIGDEPSPQASTTAITQFVSPHASSILRTTVDQLGELFSFVSRSFPRLEKAGSSWSPEGWECLRELVSARRAKGRDER